MSEQITIPYDALEMRGADAGHLSIGGVLAEVAASLLLRVVRSGAEAATGQGVEPVSITIDVTGPVSDGTSYDFATKINRQTRTMVFTGGEVTSGGRIVLTASAVYRIV